MSGTHWGGEESWTRNPKRSLKEGRPGMLSVGTRKRIKPAAKVAKTARYREFTSEHGRRGSAVAAQKG